MASSTLNMFTRDAVKALPNSEAAKAVADKMATEVQAQVLDLTTRDQATTRNAAYMARAYVTAGVLKVGRGGAKAGPDNVKHEDFGKRFPGVTGEPVSASTVGLWIVLGYLVTDVPGFDWDNPKHVTLFNHMVGSGVGTNSKVTAAVKDPKATMNKVDKVFYSIVDRKTGKRKVAARNTSTGSTGADSTSTDSGDGHTDGQGNQAPVGNIASGITRALAACETIEVALADIVKPEDVKRFVERFEALALVVTDKTSEAA